MYEGFKLVRDLPEDQKEYDSMFIHFLRIAILITLPIFVFVMCCSFGIMALAFKDREKVVMARRIPYGDIVFEEGRDCPICLN